MEQIVLEVLDRDLELVLFLNESLLLCGEVGSLLFDDEGQKLVFQTLLGNGEVDERALGLDFGRVMGIGELGVHD